MTNLDQFCCELQQLLEKYRATIGTELNDRGIIVYFANEPVTYFFKNIIVDAKNVELEPA